MYIGSEVLVGSSMYVIIRANIYVINQSFRVGAVDRDLLPMTVVGTCRGAGLSAAKVRLQVVVLMQLLLRLMLLLLLMVVVMMVKLLRGKEVVMMVMLG